MERGEPRLVRSREMAIRQETLPVDRKFAIAALVDDRLDYVGGFALEGVAWGDDGDAHSARL